MCNKRNWRGALAQAVLWVALLLPGFAFAQKTNPFYKVDSPESRRALSPQELRTEKNASSHRITLPTGAELVFEPVDIRVNAGIRTIRSTTAEARLLLTTDGANAFGYVMHGDEYYVINTVDRQAIIVPSDELPDRRSLLPGSVNDFEVDVARILEIARYKQDAGQAAQKAQMTVTVDIAFFYDQALADIQGLQFPRTSAQAAVDYTNAAFATHNADVELRLVWVGPLSTQLVGDPFSHFNANSDKWSTASDFGADLLHYIYYYSGQVYCGKAYIPGRTGVTAIECGNDTIAHELGHNFGMAHDRANAINIGTSYSGYNYGYFCGGSATLMAYGNPEVPHFSSPLLSNGGEACGVDIGQPNAAYNAAVLDITAPPTGNYTAEQVISGEVSITTSGPVEVDEDAGSPLIVELTRTGDLAVETSIEVGTVGIEAIAGQDFVDIAERVVFAVGEATAQVAIEIYNDERYEPLPESFEVVLRYPYRLNIVGDSLTVTINSEDPDRGIAYFPGWYRYVDENHGILQIDVGRSGSTDYPLTVEFTTQPVSAVPGVDYEETSGEISFGIGETAAVINIPIIDDDLFEGIDVRRFNVWLLGDNVDTANRVYRVYVENDDLYRGQGRFAATEFFVVEDAGTVDITVERINGTEDSYFFFVQYYGDGTAISGIDYRGNYSGGTSISNGNSSKVVGTDIYDNADADGEKYFDITLSSQLEMVEPTTARVYIIDDDAPTAGGGSLSLSASEFEASEATQFADITISRTGGSTGAAAVQYATTAGSASPGSDYVEQSGTLYWSGADVADKVIRIPLIDDGIIEPDETLTVNLTGAAGAALGSTQAATVTIASDDVAGTLTLDRATASLDESGYADFYVQRTEGAAGSISVSYMTEAGTAGSDVDYQSESANLYWNSGDMTSRLIRIYGIDDPDAEGHETLSLRILNPTGGAIVGAIDTATITLISDDDLPINSKLAMFGDINSSGSAEIGVSVDGTTQVSVRDASSETVIRNLNFNSSRTSVDIGVADVDGVPAMAVLAQDATGRPWVEVRKAVSGSLIRDVWFQTGYTPIALAIMPDTNGNNVSEVAVLMTNDADGRPWVHIKDVATGATVGTVWFDDGYIAQDLEVVPDVDGNAGPELAVLMVRDSDSRAWVHVKDAITGTLVRKVWFSTGYTPKDLAVIDNLDSNPGSEVAVLFVRDSDNRTWVHMKDVLTGAYVKNVWFSAGYTPMRLEIAQDLDANAGDELAVLSTRNADGRAWVLVKDALSGAAIRNVWFQGGFAPKDFALLPDIDANAGAELAVLGEKGDGQVQVEIKDAKTNAFINRVDFP